MTREISIVRRVLLPSQYVIIIKDVTITEVLADVTLHS